MSKSSVSHPMWAVAWTRIVEFIRQPEAVFWVYVFPLLMIIVLGLAFRNQAKPVQEVDLVDVPGSRQIVAKLQEDPGVKLNLLSEEECRRRLRTNKISLVIKPQDAEGTSVEYWLDPTRPESGPLRSDIDNRLQRAAGRKDLIQTTDVIVEETGGRYIDFLVPGLLGMGLMGGGLWGVGFAIVDLRIRKLLKRFIATPMRYSDFLGGIMISRMIFMIPEILLVLAFSWLLFGVRIQGSWLLLAGVVILGSIQFSGLGLLVASRCKTLESASGLMNLVMLPMWTLSGIFFSWERFPALFHPVIKVLPLTPLIDALRAIINDGAGVETIWPHLLIMALWAVVCFAVALKIFRWRDGQ